MSGSAPMVGPPDGSFAEAPLAQQPSGILESTEPLAATRQVLRASARMTSEYGVIQGPMGEPAMPMEPEEKVGPEVLNKQYGIPGRLNFTDALPDSVAHSMYETKIDEIRRQDIAQRAPAGFVSGATRLGAQFAVGLLDPLQIGAAMVPVAPEIELGTSVGARIGAAALRGAIGGTVGTAPLVGLQYGLSRQEQSDFTAYDALFELAQGAGFGAGIGVLEAGGGMFGRALSARYKSSRAMPVTDADPAVRTGSLQTGLSQLEQDNPVEVRPVYDQANAPNVPEEAGYGAPLQAAETPRATAFLPENEPKGLTSFLQQDFSVAGEATRRAGGLKDEGGDLAAIIGGPKGRPGLINNESGSSLHDAAIRAYEAGYFDHVPEDNELLDAIEKDHNRVNPNDAIYSSQDQNAADAYRYAREHNVEVDKMAAETGIPTQGLTHAQFWDQVADHLSQEEALGHATRLEQEHAEAFEQAEQAAQAWRAQHAAQGEVIGAGDLWRVPPEELEIMLAGKQESDHQKLVRALGSEEAAAEFDRLDRKQNSQNPERADQGAKEFSERFGNLTPEQERLIYGIGETDAQESDIQAVLRAHTEREPENPTEAAYEAARAMRSVSAQQILEVSEGRGSGAAQAAYVRLRNAYEDMSKAGVPHDQIGNRIAGALVERGGWSPHDAREIVQGFTESLRAAAERPRALEGPSAVRPTMEELYRGAPHTLEEMEHEWRQAESANPVLPGEGGGGQPEPAAAGEGAVQGGAGQGPGGAGAAGRAGPEERSQILQSALRDASGQRGPDRVGLAAERSLKEGDEKSLVKLAQQDIEDHAAFFQAADAAGQLTEDVRAELEGINGLDEEAKNLAAAARQAAACIARGIGGMA